MADEVRIGGETPGTPLAAVFTIGSPSPMAIVAEWNDGSQQAIQVVPEAESLTLSIDGAAQTISLPAARLNFKELKVPYYFRPRPRRYTEAQQLERLPAWQALPGAHAAEVLFEALPEADGCRIYIDRRYAGRLASGAPLRALVFRLPAGGTARAAVALVPDADPRYLALDFGAAAQPGTWLTNATTSLPSGHQLVAGIPMVVSSPARAGDIALVRQMKGSWALECDEYLSRTTFDGMPESQMLTVPQAFYDHAWVLFAADPDPARDPRMTLRLTRFAGVSVVGRGSAFAEGDLDLPRPGDPLPDNVQQVGEIRIPAAGGETALPLLLARVALPIGQMLELLAEEAQDAAAELKIGPYLDFEILGRRGDLTVQWDNRHKPAGTPSAAHVFGVTLERAPVELRLEAAQPGNIFHNDETPQLTAHLRAVRDGTYVLAWRILDIDDTCRRAASVTNLLAAGATATHILPLEMGEPGHYRLGIELAVADGRQVLTHEAAFALLGDDTREAGYESPYGVWWFGGYHLTVKDIAIAGPLHAKAGLRRTVCTLYSEAEMAPWKLTQASLRWRFKLDDLDDFPAASARVAAEIDGQRLRYPHCDNVMIFHESHANTMPAELAGLTPVYDAATQLACQRKADLANLAGAFYRERHPDLKIIVGNSGGSARLMADLLRFGFDRNYCDYIGIETPGQSFMPESISEHNVMAAWASREVGRLHGHEIPVTASYEFSYRLDRLLGARRQAEYYVRDILIGHAYGFDHISPAALDDAGASYGNTLWGSSGLLQRSPLLYPKPAYVAVATATRVLDKVAATRIIPTGSLTVYALEARRARAVPDLAYAGWTARGEAQLDCLFDTDTEVDMVDLYGRAVRRATVNRHLQWTVGTAPGYLISTVPVKALAISGRSFPQDAPPPGYTPANRMDRLDEWALSSDRYLTWINPAGGRFEDPLNWSPSRVPGTNDIALFTLANAAYTVSWAAPATNLQFTVEGAEVVWDLQGHSYILASESDCRIGRAGSCATLTVTNGTVRRARRIATYGTPLQLSGEGSALVLRDASFLDSSYPIIGAGTRIVVDGAAAKFDTHGYSRQLSGTVVVTNQGFLSAPDGFAVTDGGRLRVMGPGYRANLALGGAVGIHAGGAAAFLNGAEVRGAVAKKMYFHGALTLEQARYYYYHEHPDYGWIYLRGPDSVIQGSGRIEMGQTIQEGGAIRPGGTDGIGTLLFTGIVTNAIPGEGTLALEIAGAREGAYDRIRVEAGKRGPGLLHAGGTLEVRMLGGYQPRSAATFRILEAAAIDGRFDRLHLPPLPGVWLTDRLYTAGELTYLPPEATCLIVR